MHSSFLHVVQRALRASCFPPCSSLCPRRCASFTSREFSEYRFLITHAQNALDFREDPRERKNSPMKVTLLNRLAALCWTRALTILIPLQTQYAASGIKKKPGRPKKSNKVRPDTPVPHTHTHDILFHPLVVVLDCSHCIAFVCVMDSLYFNSLHSNVPPKNSLLSPPKMVRFRDISSISR